MDIIWHILLTVCLGSTCIEQDVQRFDSQIECESMLPVYTELPIDGDWDTVKYVCKPVGSLSA